MEEAVKYEVMAEFKKNAGGAYNYAVRTQLLEKFDWLEEKSSSTIDPNEKLWLVYAYEIQGDHVYVGLTRDLKSRDGQHKTRRDSVYKCCLEKSVPVPVPKIIKDKLTANEASELERKTVESYKTLGWSLLNAKKAGSLGNIYTSEWTKEKCREAALECGSKTEFMNKFQRAYIRSREKGWLKEYDWFVNPRSRPVIQYDAVDGALINETFRSVREAARVLDLHTAAIIRIAKTKKGTCGGYIWRYREDVLDSNGRVRTRIK